MSHQKRKMVSVTSSQPNESPEISNDLIAVRAYERWQQRGCPLWDDEQDWFAARRELEQQLGPGSEQPSLEPRRPARAMDELTDNAQRVTNTGAV